MPNPAATVLVDVSNLAFRSHFAMPHLQHEGKPTGLFHGFLSAVRMMQKLTPSIVFCFDYGTPDQPRVEPWRKKLYEPYKANRVPNPEMAIVLEELVELHTILKLLGYPCIGVPGLEADDVMGILSKRPGNFLLFSTDDDLCQLLEGGRVRVLRRERAWRFITQRNVELKMGFPISKFPYYLAMGGDHSDNIRPLPRCGAAGALALVLAGANPDLPWDQQPSAAQKVQYATPWRLDIVKSAYQVAHIPRTVNDWRVQEYCKAHPLPKSLDRNLAMLEQRRDLFLQFCAKYGLLEALGNRNKFFEANSHEQNHASGET